MLPAQERLDRDQLARFECNDGLVDKREFAGRERGFEFLLELAAQLHRRIHFLGEKAITSAALALCRIQRHVRSTRKLGQIHRSGFRMRDADAGADHRCLILEFERLVEHADDALGKCARRTTTAHRRLHDRELVAAQAREKRRSVGARGQASRDAFQQEIADAVTERIVDAFEIIEIDVEDVDVRSRRGVGKNADRAFLELGAVRQAGQRVVVREAMDARARFIVLDGDRANVHARFDDPPFHVCGSAFVPVVERERADYNPSRVLIGLDQHALSPSGSARVL